MNDARKHTGLIIAIVFAATSISGSFIFFGAQLSRAPGIKE
jgi:hypothetical protein